MTKADIPRGSVVVGHDGSEHATRALTWAAQHAALEHRTLVVVHSAEQLVVREPGWLGLQGIDHSKLDAALDSAGRSVLAEARADAQKVAPDVDVMSVLVHEDARIALSEASAHARLLVLGSRGRGPVSSALLGSVSAHVAKHASCPTVVCRPPDEHQPHGNRVIVGADGTASSAPVLDVAFAIASMRGWPLTVMHAFVNDASGALGPRLVTHADEPTELERLRVELAEAIAGLSEKYPEVMVTREFARGLVDDCLADRPPAAALLVIGRPAARGWGRFVRRSAALAVLERAHTTVAVVPESSRDAH